MQRVDERQEPGPLELDVRPGHVGRPRARMRLRVDDAVEEVDGEERAEEHDLRADEEEDPDDRRVDPRAVVDRRRMLVRVPAVGVRLPGCGSACALIVPSSETTWSTGSPVSRAQALDQVAAQPARAGARERRDDDLVDALVVGRLHRRRERIGVHDLAVGVDPLRAQLRERAAQAPVGLRARGGRSLCGATIRKLAGPCAARARTRSRSSFEITVSFATTSTLLLELRRVVVAGDRRAAPGHSPAARVISRTTSRRSQPERCSGWVETMISSGGGSSCASASLAACTGLVSTTKPCAGIDEPRRSASVFSSRRPAEARRVSW